MLKSVPLPASSPSRYVGACRPDLTTQDLDDPDKALDDPTANERRSDDKF